MSVRQWVAMTPRDTILVRDGRQFDAGADVSAEPMPPGPSTLGGAIFAAYGRREPDELRGPMMAQRHGEQWIGLFPMPGDLIHPDDDPTMVARLQPIAASTDLDAQCPQWLAGDGGPVQGWLTGAVLGEYLQGSLLAGGEQLTAQLDVQFAGDGDERHAPAGPLVRERRVGLARSDRHTIDGYLYQAVHLRPVEGVALLTECVWSAEPPVAPLGPVPLGGRGRLTDVQVVTDVGWPKAPDAFPGGRVLVYVATPAIWADGWRIPVPDGAQLVAAAVGTPLPVATASPRQGMNDTRALRWAVPAGSVYRLAFDDQDAAASWARRVHATAFGRDERDPVRTVGFGVVLTGVWP